MLYLLIASLVWAFSFGLIKHVLQIRGVDLSFVAAARLALSFLALAPFLRLRRTPMRLALRLLVVGAVQYGLMYVTYTNAYRYLAAYEIALCTILTPIYVTLISDALRRRFARVYLVAALLAVVGAGVVGWDKEQLGGALLGLVLMQVSNLSFAFGQVAYVRVMESPAADELRDHNVFGLMYLGGLVVAVVAALFLTSWHELRLSATQTWALLYLGLLPSGLCFLLWNVGARRTNAGVLAVFNNAKVPLAVVCSMLFFGERTSVLPLLVGVAAIGSAVFLAERGGKGVRQDMHS